MRFAGILTVIAAAGGLVLAAPGAVEAQQAAPQEQEVVEVTDDLLERFVAVYPEVVEVAQTAQAELAAAETPEAAQAIQAEAQTAIAAVLENGEVTVTEYEAVVTRLNEDPALMDQVQTMLLEQEVEDGTGR